MSYKNRREWVAQFRHEEDGGIITARFWNDSEAEALQAFAPPGHRMISLVECSPLFSTAPSIQESAANA